jgi:hypothetical protein
MALNYLETFERPTGPEARVQGPEPSAKTGHGQRRNATRGAAKQSKVAAKANPSGFRAPGRSRCPLLWQKCLGPCPVIPENSIRWDSRGEAESAHHPMRCLRSSTYLQRS